MNKLELEKIKKKALDEHIPIIMDDTLKVIEEELKKNRPLNILEIGTAVGYSAICFSEFLKEALRLLATNGIIFADNVLYKGYVLSDYNKHKQRTAVRNLREFLKELQENETLDTKILEVGDGLAISKMKFS